MKKILAIMLVCILTLSFVACNSGDESSAPSTNSTPSTSTPADDDSSVADEDSSEAEASTDASDVSDESSDVSTEEVEKVVFTNKFVSWGLAANADRTKLKPTDAASLNISRINQAKLLPGEVALFTPEYGLTIPSELDYTDFAIAVFEYNSKVYSYTKKSVSDIGKGEAGVKIPNDGYVLVIHKDFKSKIKAITNAAKDTVFFPHGFIVNKGLYATIAKKTATVDGKVSSSEYGKAVWSFKNDNPLVSYAQFNGDIYAEADVYLTYDKNYLYVGAVVSTPYHSTNLTADKAGELWAYDSIQVNLSSEIYGSEYMEANWDQHNGGKGVSDKVVKQYGFGVNQNGETLSTVWWGDKTESKAKVIRDDAAQKTYYEVAIPLSEFGTKDHPAGDKVGFSISINMGTGPSDFKNIVLRDGGGIIGINDFSKVPVITFG